MIPLILVSVTLLNKPTMIGDTVKLQSARELQSTELSYNYNKSEALMNATLMNAVIDKVIQTDPSMYVGQWFTDDHSYNYLTQIFDGKTNGKIRLFLFKTDPDSPVNLFEEYLSDTLKKQ